ncbi:MAG: FixG Ig-like domain-containing protein, partial [Chloroflexota bacterium]
SSTLTALLNYVNDGGALAATYWQQLAIPDHPLWAAMGFEYVANEADALPAYWWEPDHAIFTSPEEAPEWIERFARSGVTQGTYIRPLDGSLLVAGYTTSPQEDQGNIVIRHDERTVYKGIRDLSTDADANGSGVPDAVELWQNIITGLLTGFTPNVPWLSEEPAAGTVAALDSQIIEVTFDAGVPEVTQPGEYLAALQIDNNTPYGPLNIPVTMTVVDEFIYDIVLEAEMDTLSGAPGEIVGYTLHLTNTGNVPDTYTIDLSGYIWNSELTTASLSLLPGQSDSFTVSVEIPTGALAGDNDTAMVTVTSAGDPGFSDAVTLMTIATAVYGLELTAEITAASGEPGEVAIYTLYLTNTANATDTFSLELSGYTWDSDLSPDSLVLEAGESAAFTVSVDIPGDAMAGDSDVVTATVTSDSDPGVSAMANLTTIANALYGLELAPATAGITTAAGDMVNYTLTLTNTGNVSDTFTFTVAGNAWTVTLPGMVTLEAGASLPVTVMVAVPADAEAGTSDTAVVTATSANDSEASATSTLTTMIEGEIEEGFTLYLPVIMKP